MVVRLLQRQSIQKNIRTHPYAENSIPSDRGITAAYDRCIGVVPPQPVSRSSRMRRADKIGFGQKQNVGSR